jgi:hypothetical protein
MRRSLISTFAIALALAGSGCLSSRFMTRTLQASDKNVTLVQTMDVYSFAYLFPVRLVHQFWKCGESPGEMQCAKVCDVKGSDLTCPMSVPGMSTNVSSFQ